jgi:hypothetical protein
LYAAAGLSFSFSPDTIAELVGFVRREMEAIAQA